MGLLRAIGRLTVCWLAGLVAGILAYAPWTDALWSANLVFYVIGGVVFSFPFFVVAVLITVVFRKHIWRHLLGWCALAPIAVVFVWLVADYINYAWVGFGLLEFLSLKNVLVRASLVFVCASFSSILFYAWSSRHLVKER